MPAILSSRRAQQAISPRSSGRGCRSRWCVRERVAQAVRASFEITPEVAVVEAGAVERTLAAQLKPQRIADKR